MAFSFLQFTQVIVFTCSKLHFQVTNKSDMSDFYRNLLKSNVAFGARNAPKPKETHSGAEKGAERSGPESQVEDEDLKPSTSTGLDVDDGAPQKRLKELRNKEDTDYSPATRDRNDSRSPPANPSRSRDAADRIMDMDDKKSNVKEKPAVDTAERLPARKEEESLQDPKGSEAEAPKRPAVDPVAAAKERYLARKRQRGL